MCFEGIFTSGFIYAKFKKILMNCSITFHWLCGKIIMCRSSGRYDRHLGEAQSKRKMDEKLWGTEVIGIEFLSDRMEKVIIRTGSA